MTPTRSRRSAGAAALLCLLLLVACSGGDDPPPAPAVSDVSRAPEAFRGVIEPGRLLVGTNLQSRPLAFADAGAPTGFEVQLVDEVADRLGLDAEYVDAPVDALLRRVRRGRLDIAIAGLPSRPPRPGITFTEPYFALAHVVVAKKDAGIQSLDDIPDGAVAAESRTPALRHATGAVGDDVVVIEFPSVGAGFVALESDQVAAVVTDLATAARRVEAADGGLVIVEQQPTNRRYAVAVAEDNGPLLGAVNDQLHALVEDGTYATLYERWFRNSPPPQFSSI